MEVRLLWLGARCGLVLDERHVGKDDLLASNLMAAVIALEQSRSQADLLRVVDVLRERLRDPSDG